MWLPSVIASAPTRRISSASLGVMPMPPRGVLAVDDHEVGGELLAEARKQFAQDAPAGPADDVADEEDAGDAQEAIVGAWRRRTPPADVGSPLERRRPPDPPARVEPVLVPRWVQLVLLPAGDRRAPTWCCKAAGHVLLLFIIAGLIALFLNPLVDAGPARCASRAARRWRS